ncbi:hypothetical protein CN138_09210 [Sinorhizobium meliloti]|uniref:hypothetical protein n=1 Tax=Rhizobium meliloti TaxID=382 RepID=UPI000FD2EF14|nr:hypothetical protein [Sinorhizobium meliloti]RVL48495.1 hypothetical protein CN145_23335 [Sinorhizobium meliloti]RVL72427.1 hypothetical protein CN138_09210 [Sinorhizobium meliloti]
MNVEIDTRDRVVRMEVELKALKEDVDKMGAKVDEIHTLLTEARGAQKAVRFLIWLSGTSVFVWVMTYYKALVALFKG